MAVDARSMGAPSRASEIHRRELLAGLGAIPAFAATSALAVPITTRAAWDAAMQRYLAAKEACDTAWAAYKRLARNDALALRVDQLSTAQVEAETLLMELPAPDMRALHWKLAQILTDDGDGFTTPWSFSLVQPILDDAKRLGANG